MQKESFPYSWNWNIPSDFCSVGRADQVIYHALKSGQGVWQGDSIELSSLSRTQLKKLMEEKRVFVNELPIKPKDRLRGGVRIRIEIPRPQVMTLTPENLPIEILYEDKDIAVINKPQGLTVHPSPTHVGGTLVHALLHHFKDLSGIGGVLRPGIVHRLDKNTSGAMVITKTDGAHRALMEIFSKHSIERRYWALCYGSPRIKNEVFKIESLIGRSSGDRKKMAMNVKRGRHAITLIKKLEEYGVSSQHPFASLIEAQLETGRTHQVRVHLTGLGHSLLADPIYGVPTKNSSKWLALPVPVRDAIKMLPGQALHARVLGLSHPITGQALRFVAEPPLAFSRLLETLRYYFLG